MSIHAEGGRGAQHPGVGLLLALITALASTAVLVLALTGSFDNAESDESAVPVLAVPGVRADGGPEEGMSRVAATSATPAVARIGVRGVPLPATGPRGGSGTPDAMRPAVPRIGVRGVPLPASGQPGGGANPAP